MSVIDPSVFWFVGLSGAGKSTLSKSIAHQLNSKAIRCLILDGDEMRSGLCRDLGFSPDARLENIRRAAEIAKLACRQGMVVLAAFITPEEKMRHVARNVITPLPYYEIFLRCDYATCSKRDVKGLYRDADAGKIKDFTGRDSSFEIPHSPDLSIDTQGQSIADCIKQVQDFICEKALTSDSGRPPIL